MDTFNILDKAIYRSTSDDETNSFIESSIGDTTSSVVQMESSMHYDSEATEEFIEDPLSLNIYNYIYNKKPDFSLIYSSFWEGFKQSHEGKYSLTPIELKILFFTEILPGFKNCPHLTSYQNKYFDHLNDFYKNVDIDKLRTNDPEPGIHYHRADDNDTFLNLLNQPDVNIIGLTENVSYDIYSEANTDKLFRMSEGLRLCYSAFLRNAEEIYSNVILDQNEIKKRLQIYFDEGKIMPSISEINDILSSTTHQPEYYCSLSSLSPSIFLNTSRTSPKIGSHSFFSSTKIHSPSMELSSSSPVQSPKLLPREALTKSLDIIMAKGHKAQTTRKPGRDTKTLRKMFDKLRNPKLKEMERKAKAASKRFRKYTTNT